MGGRGSSKVPGRDTVPAGELVAVELLAVGDRISEAGTPHGPWYPVLRIDAGSVTIDGRSSMQEPELPVTVGYSSAARVLRHRP